MAEITLSTAVRNNLLSLQNTASLLARTQERLATGLKVNSALDDPTSFFTASSLNSRAGDLNRLLDSLSNGIQTIEAADTGLSSITKNVESLQATVNQARQDATFKSTSFSIGTIDTTAVRNVSFSGGAVGATPVNVALNTADVATVQSTVAASADYVAPTAATAGTNTFTFAADATAFGAADTSTFDIDVDGGGVQNITINQAAVQAVGNLDSTVDDINEFRDILNNLITGATATVVGGDITITSDTPGAASSVVITNATPNADGAGNANTLYGLVNGAGTNGAAAVDRVISITAGGNTANITLTAANGANATAARATITTELGNQGVTGVTVGGAGNRIDLTGLADGSNSITVAGANADDVFGAARVVTAGVQGSTGTVQTVDQLVTAINGNANLTDRVRASNDNGNLRLENLSLNDLTVTGSTTANVIDGGAGNVTVGGNEVRRDLVNQFNALRTELNKLAEDASFNGINLLRGDVLKLNFNETGTSNISIQAKDSSGAVRAINTTNLSIGSADNTEFGSNASLDARREALSSALTTLRTQASQFGSNLSIVQNRQDFTKNLINTLETGAGNLTIADTNLEGANTLALQTRQQLSSVALSLAAQADQNVLRLF